MVYQSLFNSGNAEAVAQMGGMTVVQYKKDMSVTADTSKIEYYCSKMKVNKRQLLLNLNGNGYTVQAGAMQWMSGNVNAATGVKGIGDFFGKLASSVVTNESAIKPEYTGYGQMMLEPTFRHILLTDVAEWGGSIVLDDGLFLACDSSLQQKVVARTNVSSAVFGGEGLFNLSLNGAGICALESIVPKEELFEINLQNDVLKIDGNMAIAWSGSLEFTVEKSGKSLVGSALSKEGLVNVYRGTGKVWMAPVKSTLVPSAGQTAPTENASTGQTGTPGAQHDAVDTIQAVSKVLDFFN